jgi:hypothetical protein
MIVFFILPTRHGPPVINMLAKSMKYGIFMLASTMNLFPLKELCYYFIASFTVPKQ